MHAFTEEISLPANVKIPDSHIRLLDECYKVFDEIVPNPEASERFREIFTPDGVWKTPFATYSGHDELARSGTLWTGLRERRSMRHWMYKVYANDDKCEDMMLLGRIRIEDLDGTVRDVSLHSSISNLC